MIKYTLENLENLINYLDEKTGIKAIPLSERYYNRLLLDAKVITGNNSKVIQEFYSLLKFNSDGYLILDMLALALKKMPLYVNDKSIKKHIACWRLKNAL